MTESYDCAGGLLPFRLPTHVYWFFKHRYDSDYNSRAYHNFWHIEETLGHFFEVDLLGLWEKPVEVAFAILFHDIEYTAGAKNNEKLSAATAKEWIPKFYPDLPVDLEMVGGLIEETANHGKLHPSYLTTDAQLFFDCDMAILGSEPERFKEYNREIAEEYSAVPVDLYTAGRAKFFQHLLDSERIFLSDYFYSKLEARARSNITLALNGEISVPKP